MKRFFLLLITVFIVISQVLYSQKWESCNSGPNNEMAYTPVLVASENCLFAGPSIGLFRSNDYSQSWTAIDNGIPDKNIARIGINGTNIFAATYTAGVYLSTNNGDSWKEINNGLTFKETNCITFNGSDIYLGTYGGGVFLSTNNGDKWTYISTGLKGEEKRIARMAVKDDKVFIGTYSEGVFVTSDKGVTWLQINKGLDNLRITDFVIYDNDIYISTLNHIDGTNGGIFISSDNGQNWRLLNYDSKREQIYSLHEVDGNLIAGTLSGNILISKDKGINWYSKNEGLSLSEGVSQITHCGNYIFISLQNKGIFKIERSAVGIKSDNISNHLLISPNPASDYITINLKPSEGFEPSESSAIQIYNTLGERVLSVGTGRDLSVRINISDLPKGMYFVEVGSKITKFVKM